VVVSIDADLLKDSLIVQVDDVFTLSSATSGGGSCTRRPAEFLTQGRDLLFEFCDI
jgi:hypothetical protein